MSINDNIKILLFYTNGYFNDIDDDDCGPNDCCDKNLNYV